MATEHTSESPVLGYGFNPMSAFGLMTPVNNAAPTTVHAYGLTFSRTAEGIWRATLKNPPKQGFMPFVQGVWSALDRKLLITAVDAKAGTFTFTNVANDGTGADDITGLSAVYAFVYGVRG